MTVNSVLTRWPIRSTDPGGDPPGQLLLADTPFDRAHSMHNGVSNNTAGSRLQYNHTVPPAPVGSGGGEGSVASGAHDPRLGAASAAPLTLGLRPPAAAGGGQFFGAPVGPWPQSDGLDRAMLSWVNEHMPAPTLPHVEPNAAGPAVPATATGDVQPIPRVQSGARGAMGDALLSPGSHGGSWGSRSTHFSLSPAQQRNEVATQSWPRLNVPTPPPHFMAQGPWPAGGVDALNDFGAAVNGPGSFPVADEQQVLATPQDGPIGPDGQAEAALTKVRAQSALIATLRQDIVHLSRQVDNLTAKLNVNERLMQELQYVCREVERARRRGEAAWEHQQAAVVSQSRDLARLYGLVERFAEDVAECPPSHRRGNHGGLRIRVPVTSSSATHCGSSVRLPPASLPQRLPPQVRARQDVAGQSPQHKRPLHDEAEQSPRRDPPRG